MGETSVSIGGAIDWEEAAQCRTTSNPNIMFPDAGDERGETIAKLVCKTCVVQAECLESALRRREDHGVWGGATEKERHKMLKNRARNLGRRAIA